MLMPTNIVVTVGFYAQTLTSKLMNRCNGVNLNNVK